MRLKLFFWILMMVLEVFSFGGNPKDLPEGSSQSWWAEVQRNIAESEYTVSKAESNLSEIGEALQAPNRKQNLRTWFVENGFVIHPRTTEEPEWTFGLKLTGFGAQGKIAPVLLSEPEAETRKVSYSNDLITQWCENREEGLEHGFTITYPVDGYILEVKMKITGNLTPVLIDTATLELFNEHGVRVLAYDSLAVKDSQGKTLKSWFMLSDTNLSILTDTSGAVFPLVIDPLASSPSWTGESNQANALFGHSMSSAGDVNGDGYSDVIVGAYSYDNGQTDEGRAYVYLGSASGFSTYPAWTAESDQSNAFFGISVSTAGDVNGDGYSDVIVGSQFHDNVEVDEGKVFVYYGSPSGLSASPSWTAEPDQASALFGCSVSTAGDINGDGFSDVIIGSMDYDNGQYGEGRAFVYLGSSSGLDSIPSWTAESDQFFAQFANSVSSAGDVNGDGYSDVIVGAHFYDNGESVEGMAFVYHGSASGLSSSPSWTAESNQSGAHFGWSVSSAGDVNGDGYSDIIVGAPYYDNGETDEGCAFVYHGSAEGLNSSPSWTAESNQADAKFGYSVSSAGDINGDGYSDVILGAPNYDNGEINEGRAFVYLGSSSGFSISPSWTLESDQANAQFGFSVSSAGDVNGDGYSDTIVGAPYYDNGEIDEGRAFVYLGSSSGLSTTAEWIAESNQAGAQFGTSAGTAGDVNGDGYSDVIIGAPYYDNGEGKEGRCFVYYGSSSGLSTTADWTTESNQADAYFGNTAGTAGDVNGDGYSDIIIGSPYYDNGEIDEGKVFVFYGSSTGLSTIADWTAESNQSYAFFGTSAGTAGDVNGDGYSDVIVGEAKYSNVEYEEGGSFVFYGSSSGLSTTADWTAESNQEYAYFGTSSGTAGDVNGDGYSDVFVGAPYYDNGEINEGKVFVFYGSSTGLSTTADWTTESNQAGPGFGKAVGTAGDVNGDGYSDVIVGAYYYDNGESDEGKVFVFYGSSSGLSTTADWTAESNQAGAFFGYSSGTAGDVNGDGFSDVIVGAIGYDNGENYEGRAYVYYGSSTGLSTTADWTGESNQAGAQFGISVGTAGDVNGDGYSDAIIGARFYDNGETDEGRVYAYYGNNSQGLSMIPGQFCNDEVTPVQTHGISDSPNSIILKLRGHTPFGRMKVKLQWQVYLSGLLFDIPYPSLPDQIANSGESDQWTDTEDGTIRLSEHITHLGLNQNYHWRVRLLYHPVSGTGHIASRWYSIQDNGWNDVDFRTTNLAYTVSGTITDGSSPIQGVTVSFSHDGGSVLTDASGNYAYDVSYGTTTTVSAAHSGYNNWNPDFIVLNNVASDTPGQNFTGTANGYTVSGTVTDGTDPISGVSITFNPDSTTGYAGEVVYSDINGNYSTSLPFGTTTTFSPSKGGYSAWSPPSRMITNISANEIGQNFTAILNSVTISGHISDSSENHLQGVHINFSHDGGSVVTDASGNYTYDVSYDTTTTIIPALANHYFTPSQINLTHVISDTPGQDFSAATTRFTITATSGPGGSITPSGNITVFYGEEQTFTFTSNTGYHVDYVLVDGTLANAFTSNTFRNVTANHTIHVDFALNQRPVIDSFASDKFSGNLPLDVVFICQAHDPDGGSIVQYQWDIDRDGMPEKITDISECSLPFNRTGEYPVTVTVKDDEGETAQSEEIIISVTEASPIMLPVSFDAFLDRELEAEDSRILFRIINPFKEEMNITIDCIDENGNAQNPSVITVPANGKISLSPTDFAQEGTAALKLSADHYFLITAEAECAGFKGSSYIPLQVSSFITIPHVAEEVESWQSLCYASNGKIRNPELDVHASVTALERKPALEVNLTDFLPEEPSVSDSWGTLSILASGPFGSQGELTGFEMFVKTQSDGSMVELSTKEENTLYIPHIPTETNQFWTGFAFVNPSGVPVTATSTLYSDNGEMCGTYTFDVPAYSKVKNVLEDFFPGSEGTASWGIIESDGTGLVGIELYGTENGGICGFSLNGETFTEGILPLIENSDTTWTGLAFTNPGSEDADITLKLISESGQTLSVATGTVPAGSRLSGAISSVFFTGEEIHSGQTIRFTSTSPILAVEAMGDLNWSWMKAIGAGK